MIQIQSLRKLNRSPRVAHDSDSDSLKSAFVQKLVMKGEWEERRWNDRWLQLNGTEIRYCWEKDGRTIDRIQAQQITGVELLGDRVTSSNAIENGTSSNGNSSPSIRPKGQDNAVASAPGNEANDHSLSSLARLTDMRAPSPTSPPSHEPEAHPSAVISMWDKIMGLQRSQPEDLRNCFMLRLQVWPRYCTFVLHKANRAKAYL